MPNYHNFTNDVSLDTYLILVFYKTSINVTIVNIMAVRSLVNVKKNDTKNVLYGYMYLSNNL